MQGGVAFQCGRLERRSFGLAGIEPTQRADDVLAGPKQRHHFVGIGQQRRVDHRIGVHRQDLIDAVSGDNTEWITADDLPDILAHLGF